MKTKEAGSKTRESQMMRDLFENQLKDIYWAETELTRFMPEIVSKVSSRELKKVLEDHMKLTTKQVKRLEKVFEIIGSEAEGEKCDGMEGLVKEAEDVISSANEGQIRDAFIIGAVQKVEHYETASYGTLKSLANLIGEYEVATLLGETLREEKDADRKLTEVAENFVNIEAARESGDLEDEEEEFEEDEEELEDVDDDDEDFEGSFGSKSKSKSGKRH